MKGNFKIWRKIIAIWGRYHDIADNKHQRAEYFISLGYTSSSGITGSFGSLALTFWETPILFSVIATLILSFKTTWMELVAIVLVEISQGQKEM